MIEDSYVRHRLKPVYTGESIKPDAARQTSLERFAYCYSNGMSLHYMYVLMVLLLSENYDRINLGQN